MQELLSNQWVIWIFQTVIFGTIFWFIQHHYSEKTDKRMAQYSDEIARKTHAFGTLYDRNILAFETLHLKMLELQDLLVRITKLRGDDAKHQKKELILVYEELLSAWRASDIYLQDELRESVLDFKDRLKNAIYDLQESELDNLLKISRDARHELPRLLDGMRNQMQKLLRSSEFSMNVSQLQL